MVYFALVARVVALASALIVAGATVRATASEIAPTAAAGIPAAPKPPRIIVLKDGSVMEGTVRLAQGGYEIEAPGGGRIFLGGPFVWFTAESRQNAYEQLRERYPDKTADGRVTLAGWCLDNGLPQAAQEELRIALQLEPDHAGARAMLRRHEQALRPATVAGEAPSSSSTVDSSAGSGAAPPRVAASSGSEHEFAAKIQPLLVNRCGNLHCHGTASGQAFTLQNVRPGNPAYKSMTHRNLAAVRDWIDPQLPHSSPLLVAPQQPGHGGHGKPIFVGPAGEAQLKMLSAWVAGAAKTIPRTSPGKPASSDDRLQEVSATHEPRPASEMTLESASGTVDPTADVLLRALAEQQPDAFDPEEFNRRFAPRAGDTAPSSSNGPTR